MSEPLLQFDGVQFSYHENGRRVLDGLDLAIRPGSVTAILGPNGAGKTTLLRLALGRLLPEGGQIRLAGKPLEQYGRRELGRWIGLVPQGENMSFEYSLLEYVLLGRAPYLRPLEMPGPEDVRQAEAAMVRAGLEGYARRSILTLSGGERQLLLLARALAQQPRLLLLDEPTTHLDLHNKVRLLGLLKDLARQGVTIVLTTHEPDAAAAIATDLVLMRDGQVQHAGPVGEGLTGERLSALYGVPVQVREIDGHRIVLWS
jgi:iron complex transport system ATP-binding protein